MGRPIKKSSRLVHAPSKAKAYTAFVILALGVALMPSGFLLANLIETELDAGIKDSVAVPHPHSSDYDEWVSNDYEDAVPMVKSFYMWNMLNPEGILAGEKPQYEEVGPFNFRIYSEKYDVKFSDSKNEVTYKSYTRYEELPGSNSLDTNITNINPGYLGVLADKGSEAGIVEAFFTEVLTQVQDMFAEELNAVLADLLTEEGIRNLLETELLNLLGPILDSIPDWIMNLAIGAIQLVLQGFNFALEAAELLLSAANALLGGYQWLLQQAINALDAAQGPLQSAQNALAGAEDYLEGLQDDLEEALNTWYLAWMVPGLWVAIELAQLALSAARAILSGIESLFAGLEAAVRAHEADIASVRAEITGYVADINVLQSKITGIVNFLGDSDSDINAWLVDIVLEILFAIIPPEVIVEILADAMPSADEIFFEEWANDYFPEVDLDLSILADYYKGLLDGWSWGFLDILGPIKDIIIDLLQDLVDWVILESSLIGNLEALLEDFIRDMGADMVDEEGSTTGEGVDIDGRDPYLYEGPYSDLNIVDRETEGASGITQAQCKLLWDNESANSLTGMDAGENPIWFDAVDGDEEARTALMAEFGLTEVQLDYILRWIEVSVTGWLANICEWTILNDYESGLIVTRTVEEWLFTAEDKLILESTPEKANVNIFDNCQNSAEAEESGTASYTQKTGRGDVSDVGEIVAYNGEEQIYLWAEPIDVAGTNGLQFAPGVDDDDTLDVFSNDLMRTMEFEFTKEKELYDIELLRFKLSEETFAADPFYSMDRDGLAKLDPVYDGVAVSISKPHFLDGDPTLATSIGGVMPSGDHDMYIDVEPITGLTMRARKRYQVNLGVVPTDLWFTDVLQNDMPIVWVEEGGEITEELADEFKDLVYGAMELKETVPLMCLGIGAALCIPGVLVNTTQSVKRENFKAVMAKRKKLGALKKAKLLGTTDAPELENVLTGLKGGDNTSLKFSTVFKPESAKD